MITNLTFIIYLLSLGIYATAGITTQPLNTIIYNEQSYNVVQLKGLADLENKVPIFFNNKNTINQSIHNTVFHLQDLDNYVIPNEPNQIEHKFLDLSFNPLKHLISNNLSSFHYCNSENNPYSSIEKSPIPRNWIQFSNSYFSKTKYEQGISIMSHSIISNNATSISGDMSFGLSSSKRISIEDDLYFSLYYGIYFILGFLAGLRISPELELLKTNAITYNCRVDPSSISFRNQSTLITNAIMKIYPNMITLEPYIKKLQWNNALQKFVLENSKLISKKISLLTMTGMEDVECLYI